MKLRTKIILSVIVLVGYIFFVNLFAELLTINDGKIPSNTIRTIDTSGGATVELGFSDLVAVELTRNRMYGKIIVAGEVEHLYLFSLIKLPKKVYGWNFYWFHSIFLILYISFLVFVGRRKSEKNSEQNVYKGESSYDYYEGME